MLFENKNRTEKRGITVTMPWHITRTGVAYHSHGRGIAVTGCGIAVTLAVA